MLNENIKSAIISKFGVGDLLTYAKLRVFELNLKGKISIEDNYDKYYWGELIESIEGLVIEKNREIYA